MKNSFEQFYEILKLDKEKSTWSQKQTLQDRFIELKLEVEEVGQAIKNDDIDNLKEELGDVLWDLLSIMIIAEDGGLFKKEDVVADVTAKIKRRKPWIFEDGKMMSLEKELEIFYINKKKEKLNNSN